MAVEDIKWTFPLYGGSGEVVSPSLARLRSVSGPI